MSRADGILVVSLTHKWFDMVASGEKREEYRGANWFRKLLTEKGQYRYPVVTDENFVQYHTLRAQRAYSGVWLERKIKRIRWGKPRPEWSGDTVTGECFVIELDPCA